MSPTKILSALTTRRPDWRQVALQLGDAGFVVCLFVTPLLLGGRHGVGRMVYVLGAAMAAAGVFGHAALKGQRLAPNRGVLALFGAAMALVALQVAPLPEALQHLIGSDLAARLPLWGGAPNGFGEWGALSFTPAATAEGIALLIAHGLLTMAVLARVKDASDIRRLLIWIASASVGMALLGFAQYAAPNGKLLWLYDHPHRDFGKSVQGAFANKNHFAHFLLLGIGPACWLAGRTKRESKRSSPDGKQRAFWLIAATLLLVAALASQSRGGVLALAGVVGVIAFLGRRSSPNRLVQVGAVVMVVLGGVTGVSLFGYDSISNRMDDLFYGRVEQLDEHHARRSIWAANVAAFRSSPWVGLGVGSHREAYPLFIEGDFTREFTHAECGYLQVASESGAAGLTILFTTIGMLAVVVFRGVTRGGGDESSSLWVAIAPGLVASVIHSAVDFVWYIPGLLAPTLVLAACAIRLEQITRTETSSVADTARRGGAFTPFWVTTLASAAAIALCLAPARAAPDWDRYLRSSVGLRGMMQQLAFDAGSGSDKLLHETIVRTTGHTTEQLDRVLEKHPKHARAHLRMAGRLLQRYELETADSPNAMPASVIRDVALRGGFESQRQLHDWLDRALGEKADLLRKAHRHASAAVRLCPLQSEAYLYLASLSFLDPTGPSPIELVDQAVRLCPNDGEVLFEAGRQYWLAGDADRGIELWKQCSKHPGSHLFKLVVLLSQTTPASFFVEQLEPGYEAVDLALKQYRARGTEADLKVLCKHAVAEAERATAAGEMKPIELARRWRHASETLRLIQQNEESVRCAQHALELAPYDLKVRVEIATALWEADRCDDADPHIRWCLARRPDFRYLQNWLKEAAKRKTQVERNRRSRVRLYAALPTQLPPEGLALDDERPEPETDNEPTNGPVRLTQRPDRSEEAITR